MTVSYLGAPLFHLEKARNLFTLFIRKRRRNSTTLHGSVPLRERERENLISISFKENGELSHGVLKYICKVGITTECNPRSTSGQVNLVLQTFFSSFATNRTQVTIPSEWNCPYTTCCSWTPFSLPMSLPLSLPGPPDLPHSGRRRKEKVSCDVLGTCKLGNPCT